MPTYTLTEQSITCHTCGRTSWHPQDRAERYCDACHVFHDDRAILQMGMDLWDAWAQASPEERPAVLETFRQRWRDEFPGVPLPRRLALPEDAADATP